MQTLSCLFLSFLCMTVFFYGARNVLATSYTPVLSQLNGVTHGLSYSLLKAEMLKFTHNRIRLKLNQKTSLSVVLCVAESQSLPE